MKVFLSYPHVPDVDAAVGAFHSRLQGELRLQVPDATIFLDTENIPPGSEFPKVLRSELATSDIFIPLLSPAWFASSWCRQEYSAFVTPGVGRDNYVLPVDWVGSPGSTGNDKDPLRLHFANKQSVNWSSLRHHDADDSTVREQTASLAANVVRLTDQRRPAHESIAPSADFKAALPGLEYSLMALPRDETETAPENQEIVRAVWKAIDATEDHLRVLRSAGMTLREPNIELRELWTEAAARLVPREPAVARLLRAKASFWGDPANWDEEEAEHADISMRNLRRASNDLIDRLSRS